MYFNFLHIYFNVLISDDLTSCHLYNVTSPVCRTLRKFLKIVPPDRAQLPILTLNLIIHVLFQYPHSLLNKIIIRPELSTIRPVYVMSSIKQSPV
jgi:hypothetical protein